MVASDRSGLAIEAVTCRRNGDVLTWDETNREPLLPRSVFDEVPTYLAPVDVVRCTNLGTYN